MAPRRASNRPGILDWVDRVGINLLLLRIALALLFAGIAYPVKTELAEFGWRWELAAGLGF